MKRTKQAVCLLLALLMVAGTLMLPSAAGGSGTNASAVAGTDTAGTYTKKVVSVLYDNSYSMLSQGQYYAKYAIQALAALLGPEDALLMTPMNVPGSFEEATDDRYTYEVDLSKEDRNTQIAKMLTDSFLSYDPDGSTPFEPINITIQQLIDRGMKTQADASFEAGNTEYWLFVMTDGVFTTKSTPEAVESEYVKYIKKYSNFHMVHLGFGDGAKDMSRPVVEELKNAGNYSAYHSKDTTKLMATMQSIANQISGRYTADAAVYTANGNQITVHLDSLRFAVHNLSLLVQNADGVLQSATYKGQALQISQACTIVAPDYLVNKEEMGNGYSAVIKPGAGLLSGGDIVLTFTAPVGDISIMVEPALKLRTVVERREGNGWVPTDELYINSFMKEGDQIRVDYEVYEEGSGSVLELSDIFNPIEESVTYAGYAYQPGDSISLVEGNHEILVNVSAMNGTYQLYDSFSCIVWKEPTNFRIEGVASSTDGGKGNAYDLFFTVIYEGKPLSAAELAAYTWLVKGTDAKGDPISLSPQVTADGRIKAAVNLSSLPAGDAVFYAKVTSPQGFVRETTLKLKSVADLKLHLTVERREGSGWVEAERQYIHRYMKPGDELRATYRLYDEERGVYVNAADVMGSYTETVTYAGGTYQPGAPFPLSAGKHDVTVTVRSDDGAYVLTGSFSCTVLSSTTDFRIEGSDTVVDQGLGLHHNATFLVYVNNKPLTAAELAGYSWQITGKDANGTPLTLQPAAQGDGSILVPLDLTNMPFGKLRLEATVTDPDGFTRDTVLEITHEPKSITAVVVGADRLSKTQYQLTQNADGFAFAVDVASAGSGTRLSPALYTYKVTVKGKDVTKYCTVEGDNVVFVPTKESLGELTGQLGDLEVLFTAQVTASPDLTDSATATLAIATTVYEVIVSVDGEGVDPFRVKDDELYIYVTVRRDGIPLSSEELLAAKESGALDIRVQGGFLRNRFGFFKVLDAVEDHDGMPALRIAPCHDKAWLAYCITGMVAFPGERTVHATYQGAAGSDGYEIFHPGALAYILRLLIYFLILHIVMLIVGYRRVDRFAPGRYFRVSITLNDHNVILNANVGRPRDVNRTFFSRILWRRLFIPCVYWFRGTQKLEMENGNVVLTATGMRSPNVRIKYNNRFAGSFLAAMKVGDYPDVPKIQARLRNGQYNGQDLRKMSIGFEERPLFKVTEQSGKSTPKRQNDAFRNLSDFRNPICIKKTGSARSTTYILIFYIPD